MFRNRCSLTTKSILNVLNPAPACKQEDQGWGLSNYLSSIDLRGLFKKGSQSSNYYLLSCLLQLGYFPLSALASTLHRVTILDIGQQQILGITSLDVSAANDALKQVLNGTCGVINNITSDTSLLKDPILIDQVYADNRELFYRLTSRPETFNASVKSFADCANSLFSTALHTYNQELKKALQIEDIKVAGLAILYGVALLATVCTCMYITQRCQRLCHERQQAQTPSQLTVRPPSQSSPQTPPSSLNSMERGEGEPLLQESSKNNTVVPAVKSFSERWEDIEKGYSDLDIKPPELPPLYRDFRTLGMINNPVSIGDGYCYDKQSIMYLLNVGKGWQAKSPLIPSITFKESDIKQEPLLFKAIDEFLTAEENKLKKHKQALMIFSSKPMPINKPEVNNEYQFKKYGSV